MEQERCEAIVNELDEKFDSIERKFILWELLGRYRDECMKASKEIKSEEVAAYAELSARKCSDLQGLIGHDLW